MNDVYQHKGKKKEKKDSNEGVGGVFSRLLLISRN